MARDDRIQLFENKRIRTAWDAEKEECYFSIVDVVAVPRGEILERAEDPTEKRR